MICMLIKTCSLEYIPPWHYVSIFCRPCSIPSVVPSHALILLIFASVYPCNFIRTETLGTKSSIVEKINA